MIPNLASMILVYMMYGIAQITELQVSRLTNRRCYYSNTAHSSAIWLHVILRLEGIISSRVAIHFDIAMATALLSRYCASLLAISLSSSSNMPYKPKSSTLKLIRKNYTITQTIGMDSEVFDFSLPLFSNRNSRFI